MLYTIELIIPDLIQPRLLLAPYVRYDWILEMESVSKATERVIPFGNMQWCFYRGGVSDLAGLKVSFRPKTEIESKGMGYFALFLDSEGNRVGLYSDK